MIKTRKLVSLILSIIILLGILPINAFTVNAKTEYTKGYYTYTISNGEATITHCDTSISGGVTIPSTLGGYPVTSIGDYAFSSCTSLTSITIPDSITSIGCEVFYYCTSLTSITIPDSVTSIVAGAFFGCSSLTSITIPDSVTRINSYTFCDCTSLTSIKIPNSVTSISFTAFLNTGYYNDSSNWENGVLYIGKHLIDAKETLSDSYSIKSGTKIIIDNAFLGCTSLTSITIPNSVTNIGDHAFYECESLKSVIIGNSVTSIDRSAFFGCTSLKDVYYCGTEEEWNNISIDSYNTDLIDAKRYYHNFSDWQVRTETTCTEKGEKYRICSSCGEEETKTISATGHTYSSVITKATCTKQGYTTYTCKKCGDSYIDDFTEALGHDFDAEFTVDKEVTVFENGSKSRHCKRCDAVTDITTIIIPMKITLYRYRNRIETTSKIPLEFPWTLISQTFSSPYPLYREYDELLSSELSNIEAKYSDDWFYTSKDKDGFKIKYTTQPKNGSAYYFDKALPEAGMYQNNYSYAYHPTTGIKLYYRGLVDTYTIKVYTKYVYNYFKWSDWSIWSEKPYTASDDIEVEKIQTYDETLDSENLITLRQSLLNSKNNMFFDYNADEKIDVKDLVRLKRYLATI